MSLAWVKGTIPATVRQRLRHQRELLADARMHPGLALMRVPLLSRLIAAVIKPRDPPILLVSLPRGGSSWIGGILGSAKESLYLREPRLAPVYQAPVPRRS